jgi:hypothetical protein
MRPHRRAGFGDDLRGKPKVIDVRVRDDDAANVLERDAARAEFGAQRVERRRVFRSGIDERQLIARREIDVDRTNREGCWNRNLLQIIENGSPLHEPCEGLRPSQGFFILPATPGRYL